MLGLRGADRSRGASFCRLTWGFLLSPNVGQAGKCGRVSLLYCTAAVLAPAPVASRRSHSAAYAVPPSAASAAKLSS